MSIDAYDKLHTPHNLVFKKVC